MEIKLANCTSKEDVLEQFPDLSDGDASVVVEILEGKCVGKRVSHIWKMDRALVRFNGRINKYWNCKGQKVLCNGKIEKKKRTEKKLVNKYVVAYWLDEQAFEDAEDYELFPKSVAADYICGDLSL